MGYYTHFEIETINDNDGSAKADLITTSGYTWDDADLYDTKWYDWATHLASSSKRFPDVTFVLSGVGEEHPDMWKAWARGGRVEQVEIGRAHV